MSTRRRGLLILLVLLAAAGVIAAVVLAGGPPDEESTGTSAFDPSVPTSTQTPPPAGSASPSEEPSDSPSNSPPSDEPSDSPSDSSTGPSDPSDPSTGTASPSTPSLSPEEQAEISNGTSQIIDTILAQTAEIDPAVTADVVGEFSDVASRAYLSELQSERLEFETEGWTRVGSYSLGEVEVLDHSSSSDGEVATVRVCVDSSGLVTRRADGEVIETSPASTRAWNIFVLERADSADWRITGRTFPDDPTC